MTVRQIYRASIITGCTIPNVQYWHSVGHEIEGLNSPLAKFVGGLLISFWPQVKLFPYRSCTPVFGSASKFNYCHRR